MTDYIIENMKYINEIYSFALLCFPVSWFTIIDIDQQNVLIQHHTYLFNIDPTLLPSPANHSRLLWIVKLFFDDANVFIIALYY